MGMIRVSAIIVGLFLVACWIAGLSVNAAAWITWLDGVGALLAFIVAAMPVGEAERANGRSVLAGLVSLGLFAMWIIGLVTHTQAWIVWCTFAAACALAFVAFGRGGPVRAPPTPHAVA